MAKRFYQPLGTPVDQLNLFIDPTLYTQAQDNIDLTEITEIQGLSADTRELIATALGFSDLATYDDFLQDQEWEIRDRLDYYSLYENRVENITVRDGAWFTPEAVESFCGEHTTNVAANSIDGVNTTIYQHNVNHAHNIVYRLRSYPKKITKVRFRYGSAEPDRERLNNLTIKAARALSQIDESSNILESNLNIVWPTPGGVWVEHTLATPKVNVRYIKLETADTDHPSNHWQIREFAVRVVTRDP